MVQADLIRQHYRLLNHQSQTEIRVFGGDSPSGKYSYFVNTEDEFVETVTMLDDQGLNVGVGVNERSLNGTSDDEVVVLRFIPLDLDSVSQEDQDKVESFLTSNNIPISAKVFSGQKGYHYYVPIDPITDQLEIRRVLNNAKAFLTPHIPLDAKCFNPSRIFRVWGSRNRGREVELRQLEPLVAPINASTVFPQASQPNVTRIGENTGIQKVIPNCSFLNALFNKTLKITLNQDAFFNDEILPNAVAYAQAKRLNLQPIYELAKQNGQSDREVDGWLRKKRDFNYATVRQHVKDNYPDAYNQYFKIETQNQTSNLRYEDFQGTDREYKTEYRGADWFTITNNRTIKARVVSYDNPKELVQLALQYTEEPKDDEELLTPEPGHRFMFFDEIIKHGPFKPKEAIAKGLNPYPQSIETNLYSFNAITQDNEEWQVFSEERLDSGDYVLHGTRFDISDSFKIGRDKKASMKTSKRVLLLHSYENEEKAIKSFEELYEKIPFTKQETIDWLMTDLNLDPPPTYDPGAFLKEIYLAWLFSGQVEGNPLNLVIMGPPGSGKSPQLTSISQKFNEPMASGGQLTIKGLTVSFWGDNPKPGAFLKAKRILPIDELFKILNNRNLTSYEDLTSLNGMLDNKEYTADSGKFTIKIKAQCRLLAATNPIHERFTHSKSLGNRMSFARLCEVLPSDFVGRLVFLIQTKEEFEAVTGGKRIAYNDRVLSLSNRDWLSAYDFINNTDITNVDSKRVRKITQEMKMPDVFRDVYSKHSTRNGLLFFQGIVRTRCFAERLHEFKATETDYQTFERLWKELHLRWFDSVEGIEDTTVFLTDEEKSILKLVQDAGEITWYQFERAGCSGELREKLRSLSLVEYNREKKTVVALGVDSVRLS